MAQQKISTMITLRLPITTAEKLKGITNRSEFIRQAIEEKLGTKNKFYYTLEELEQINNFLNDLENHLRNNQIEEGLIKIAKIRKIINKYL